jgi:hypothetical protein
MSTHTDDPAKRWLLSTLGVATLAVFAVQGAPVVESATVCEGIQVLSDGLSPAAVEAYCRYAVQERQKVEAFWGATWREPIRIHVSSAYRISRALVPGYFGNRGFLEMPLHRARENTGALLHEIVHIYAPNTNRFLAEGLAVYLHTKLAGNPAFPNFGEDLRRLAIPALASVESLDALNGVRTPDLWARSWRKRRRIFWHGRPWDSSSSAMDWHHSAACTRRETTNRCMGSPSGRWKKNGVRAFEKIRGQPRQAHLGSPSAWGSQSEPRCQCQFPCRTRHWSRRPEASARPSPRFRARLSASLRSHSKMGGYMNEKQYKLPEPSWSLILSPSQSKYSSMRCDALTVISSDGWEEPYEMADNCPAIHPALLRWLRLQCVWRLFLTISRQQSEHGPDRRKDLPLAYGNSDR